MKHEVGDWPGAGKCLYLDHISKKAEQIKFGCLNLWEYTFTSLHTHSEHGMSISNCSVCQETL